MRRQFVLNMFFRRFWMQGQTRYWSVIRRVSRVPSWFIQMHNLVLFKLHGNITHQCNGYKDMLRYLLLQEHKAAICFRRFRVSLLFRMALNPINFLNSKWIVSGGRTKADHMFCERLNSFKKQRLFLSVLSLVMLFCAILEKCSFNLFAEIFVSGYWLFESDLFVSLLISSIQDNSLCPII